MPFDTKTFRVRATTAIIFMLVMFAGLFINWWLFVCLFLIVMVGSLNEFFKILKLVSPEKPALRLMALPYIVLPIILLIDLASVDGIFNQGFIPVLERVWPCAIIFSIWINDTMAYIVGSFIGKTPFSKISPKKTWEGTIGGAILCVAVIAGLSRMFTITSHLPAATFIIIASISAVFGTLGDLLESKLKRMAGIKDSGKIMPGHGGFLDRFDSLLVAIPFVWIYIRVMLGA